MFGVKKLQLARREGPRRRDAGRAVTGRRRSLRPHQIHRHTPRLSVSASRLRLLLDSFPFKLFLQCGYDGRIKRVTFDSELLTFSSQELCALF
jgi:hypothetical protein